MLQLVVGNLVLERRYEGLGLFRVLAAQRTYLLVRPGRQKGSRRWQVNLPNCALSNLDSCVAELSSLSTASTFSFLVNRAKLSR